MLEASGAEIMLPDPEICEKAARQWEIHDGKGGEAEWPALLRMADRHDKSYRQ